MIDMFKVPNDDQSLRISMENLKLRDNQEEEYVSRNQYHLVRGRIDQLIDEEPSVGQADGAWNGMRSAEAQPDETEKLEQVNRRRRTLTEKGREYRILILDKKKSSLVSRIIRKSSEIDDLMYSYQNATTVKEELAQLNDIYKLIVEIIDEMTEIDVNYSKELWFAKFDEKIFSFKHKVHNWLREGQNGAKRETGSKSSGSRAKSSGSSRSTGSRSSRMSSKEKTMQEKLRGKTRKHTWDGPLLTEQRDQRKNYVILRDRHQRDKKTVNNKGIKMIIQSALNIGNQNEMIH